MGGIDDEIQDDLIKFPGQARNRGQGTVELSQYFSEVFPLVASHGDRALNGMVQVDRALLPSAWVRELFHGPNDRSDALDAFEGLFNGFGNLRQKIIEVSSFVCSFQFRGEVWTGRLLFATAEKV